MARGIFCTRNVQWNLLTFACKSLKWLSIKQFHLLSPHAEVHANLTCAYQLCEIELDIQTDEIKRKLHIVPICSLMQLHTAKILTVALTIFEDFNLFEKHLQIPYCWTLFSGFETIVWNLMADYMVWKSLLF